MKKTIIILTAIMLIVACKSEKKVSPVLEKPGVYFSLFKKDGKVTDGAVRIFVDDRVITDSLSGKKSIDSKVIYAVLGNVPSKTKEGKDTVLIGWTEIKKDSVKITNPLTIDSLFKSFQ